MARGKVNVKFCTADVSVAFSTRLHQDTTIDDSPVIFGTVDLNIGDGYDEFTGKKVNLTWKRNILKIPLNNCIIH